MLGLVTYFLPMNKIQEHLRQKAKAKHYKMTYCKMLTLNCTNSLGGISAIHNNHHFHLISVIRIM